MDAITWRLRPFVLAIAAIIAIAGVAPAQPLRVRSWTNGPIAPPTVTLLEPVPVTPRTTKTPAPASVPISLPTSVPQISELPDVKVPEVKLPDTKPPRPMTPALQVDDVVREVETHNQTLAQMNAAWQAATTKYAQVTSPDDPMFSSMVAPNSFGSNSVQPGYRAEISQKILWPGKKSLRGTMALSEAGAAGDDVQDMRLQLIEMARSAYYDYFLVERAIAVNDQNLKLLDEFRRNADARFRTGQISQQDVLQAEVEIGKQRERGITLERMRRVAIARLNTLMHREPTSSLPPPVVQLPRGTSLPPAEQLIGTALAGRPDLRALEARLNSDRAALALAIKEYWPDVELAAAYDTIMGNGPMRDLAPQVGLRMNLPVRAGRRNAAVAEAQAKISQRCAELAAKIDQVKFLVQEAYEQVIESDRIVDLYETKILPQSADNVKSAQSAYVTGKIPFVSLVEAQRSLVSQRDRAYEASADAYRRRATLDRLVGKAE